MFPCVWYAGEDDRDDDAGNDNDGDDDNEDEEQKEQEEESAGRWKEHKAAVDTADPRADHLGAAASSRAMRPSPQPGAARPILIAAAGALLACIVILTLMASWARRWGAEEHGMLMQQRRVHYLPVHRTQQQPQERPQPAVFVEPQFDAEAGQALQQPLLPQ